jgi:pyridoxamine 5'-phosphate oxidase family protein
MVFTDAELLYLRSQRLGRLATLSPHGQLQNSPVGFSVDEAGGVINIYGRDLANSQKFHNVAANGKVALVVDDIASFDPWVVRCFEVRGTAEALAEAAADQSESREVIRIHPRRIISWGMGADGTQGSKRNVAP